MLRATGHARMVRFDKATFGQCLGSPDFAVKEELRLLLPELPDVAAHFHIQFKISLIYVGRQQPRRAPARLLRGSGPSNVWQNQSTSRAPRAVTRGAAAQRA